MACVFRGNRQPWKGCGGTGAAERKRRVGTRRAHRVGSCGCVAVRWPRGVLSSGIACGIKRGGAHDLGVITLDDAAPWAGVFTLNAAAAAPVMWCRERLGAPVRAIVVNSGNANACTGPAGSRAVEATAAAAAEAGGCSRDEVLVASTGPIGIPLPVDAIEAALPGAI